MNGMRFIEQGFGLSHQSRIQSRPHAAIRHDADPGSLSFGIQGQLLAHYSGTRVFLTISHRL